MKDRRFLSPSRESPAHSNITPPGFIRCSVSRLKTTTWFRNKARGWSIREPAQVQNPIQNLVLSVFCGRSENPNGVS